MRVPWCFADRCCCSTPCSTRQCAPLAVDRRKLLANKRAKRGHQTIGEAISRAPRYSARRACQRRISCLSRWSEGVKQFYGRRRTVRYVIFDLSSTSPAVVCRHTDCRCVYHVVTGRHTSPRHDLHEDLRRRTALSHIRPDSSQLLWTVRRHHWGGGYYRQTDRQEPRIWLRECMTVFWNKRPLKFRPQRTRLRRFLTVKWEYFSLKSVVNGVACSG